MQNNKKGPSVEFLVGKLVTQVGNNRFKVKNSIETFANDNISVSSEENDPFQEAPYLEALVNHLGGGGNLLKVNPFTLLEFEYLWVICSDLFCLE